MSTTTESLMEKYSRPSYIVYRKNKRSSYDFPEGMIYFTQTGTIEPEDITQCPMTKERAKAFIQHFYPEMKKSTLDKLVKDYGLQKHRMQNYIGYVYLHPEVREAVARFKEAQQGN